MLTARAVSGATVTVYSFTVAGFYSRENTLTWTHTQGFTRATGTGKAGKYTAIYPGNFWECSKDITRRRK